MIFAIMDLLKGADVLVYPLGVCSVVLVFILCERGFALRKGAVLPDEVEDALLNGTPLPPGGKSVMERVVAFAEAHPGDAGAARAFLRLEVGRMERGLPFLDVIYAGAPLIGLTGTVWSLIRVFMSISGETGLPDPVRFTSGVSLALSATVLGLVIAVPALVGNGVLQRLVDKYAARMDVLLEHLLARSAAGK
jgi:biopolymer transport protein ExbB